MSENQNNYQELNAERFDEIISQLRAKKSELETELRHEYRKARRYVRANPEQGVAGAFIGGMCVGLLVSKILNK